MAEAGLGFGGAYNQAMIDEGTQHLAKAEESLAGAESEFAAGRYNNCANRAYYACFQAAVAALIRADVVPSGRPRTWDHAFVHGRFAGQLVNRRKLYPASLRDTLRDTFTLRERGDYRPAAVSRRQAAHALDEARRFVEAVVSGGGSRP